MKIYEKKQIHLKSTLIMHQDSQDMSDWFKGKL